MHYFNRYPFFSVSRTGALLSLAVALGLFQGCGGGSGTSATSSSNDSVNYLIGYLKDWYLWFDRLPASINAAAYSTTQAALDALRVPEDKFSGITPEATYNEFFVEGQLTGYGFVFKKKGDVAQLLQVQPAGPAFAAGLRRGDEILEIDGKKISDMANDAAVSEAIGPSTAGVSGNYLIRSPSQTDPNQYQSPRKVAMSKALYPVTYIFDHKVLPSAAGKVGFIHHYSFSGSNLTQWRAALSDIINQGAEHLVLDLRDNGGGRISDAVAIASAMGPSTAQNGGKSIAGSLAVTLEHNSSKRAADNLYYFSDDPFADKFKSLVILASDRTCSASEIVIQALKPYRKLFVLGSKTCGKPFGFTPFSYQGFVYSIVNFRARNAAGETDYVDGLTPTCELPDPIRYSNGDEREPYLKAAIGIIETGNCPTQAFSPVLTEKANSKNLIGNEVATSWPADWHHEH